jgi:hypothetical protein
MPTMPNAYFLSPASISDATSGDSLCELMLTFACEAIQEKTVALYLFWNVETEVVFWFGELVWVL